MNKPDTNQASELFELCKEVYEKTGWNNQELLGGWIQDQFDGPENRGTFTTRDQIETILFKLICPLYTSDYLLEKLDKHEIRTRSFNGNSYAQQFSTRIEEHSNTLRKALLKLVIALGDAGVKL